MQIEDDSQIQPSLTRPNITGIARPVLVRQICVEVTVEQVRCDIEFMVAVGCNFVFAGPHDRYAGLAHQAAHTPMANILANLFQSNPEMLIVT